MVTSKRLFNETFHKVYSSYILHNGKRKSKHHRFFFFKNWCYMSFIRNKHSGSIPRNACVARETYLCAMRDYQESVTTRHTDTRTGRQTDRQTPGKVIPTCRRRYKTTHNRSQLSLLWIKNKTGNQRIYSSKKTPVNSTQHKYCNSSHYNKLF